MSLAFDEFGRPFIILRVRFVPSNLVLAVCTDVCVHASLKSFVSAGARQKIAHSRHRGSESQYTSSQSDLQDAAVLSGAEGHGQNAAES